MSAQARDADHQPSEIYMAAATGHEPICPDTSRTRRDFRKDYKFQERRTLRETVKSRVKLVITVESCHRVVTLLRHKPCGITVAH